MQLIDFGKLCVKDIENPLIRDLMQLNKHPRRQELAGMVCEAAAAVIVAQCPMGG
jgi:hypothetical protein